MNRAQMFTRFSGLTRPKSSRNVVHDRRLGQTVWSARRLARKLARVAVGGGPAVEPQLREAPVMGEGSWVGLDVHARSVVAGVIDTGSGEVRSLRVPPGPAETVAWLKTLPAPVRVVYEAGPTGYGLRVRVPRRGSAAWLRRRRRSGRRPTGSRPTGGTPSGWRGCFGSARSPRCGCPSRKRRPRVISSVRVRTPAAI